MPILGCSNSATDKDMMSKIWANGDPVISECVENIVVKGEIARYEQFLLFPQCFQKIVLQTRKNKGLFGEKVK